jgi:DHA1 family bicyclomycin/chloramphenicol resistance-like MFS transporter
MPEAPAPRTLSTFELVVMVAALSALNSVSIDAMLPALPDIGRAFDIAHDNDRQLVIVAYVAPFGIAQLVYGPLSDSFGRRSVLVWALGLFLIGSVLCVAAPNFGLLLAARALQGIGAAATRVVSTAVVRDLTAGRRMAQIMSMAMSVFMLVPILAPGLGQLILFVAPWRWIFGALLIYAVAVTTWILLRLPETLAPENRAAFRPAAIAHAYAAVFQQRQTFGYMLAMAFVAAAMFGYVTACEQIFVEVFDLGPAFPLAFASVAIAMMAGGILNSRLVMRVGMRRLSHSAALWMTALAAFHAALAAAGLISFWPFMVLLALTLAAFGMIGGNLNALAMEPMGQQAGTASAMFGGFTTVVGAVLGGLIGRAFDGTPLPFLAGMAIVGAASVAVMFWTERGRLFRDPPGLGGPKTAEA